LQSRDVFAGRVDWATERRTLMSQLDQHPTLAVARQLIEQALSDLNDGHGRLLPPGRTDGHAPTAGVPTTPHGRMLPNRVGYLLLPAVSADPGSQEAAAYAARGEELIRSLAGRGASAWIVDLRWNTGGDMYPMLAAVGGLLDRGRIIGFQPTTGSRTWVAYDGGAFSAGGHQVMAAPAPEPPVPQRPRVALLIGSQTASSGEAVLVAFLGQRDIHTFGQPTFGVPNAPTTVPLNDGYAMEYSAEKDIDRTGRPYEGPIAPEQSVAAPKGFVAGDAEMQAAVQWLRPRQQQLGRAVSVGVAIALIVLAAVGLVRPRVRRERMSG
jgi:carboxyl-terminal processing protease